LLKITVGTTEGPFFTLSFGPHSFSDLDFADVVALLAEPAYLNSSYSCTWDGDIRGCIYRAGDELAEDKVQALSTQQLKSPDTCISCRNAITRAAMQNLDNQIWKSRISIF